MLGYSRVSPAQFPSRPQPQRLPCGLPRGLRPVQLFLHVRLGSRDLDSAVSSQDKLIFDPDAGTLKPQAQFSLLHSRHRDLFRPKPGTHYPWSWAR
jgi:hypothetical protein